MRKFLLLSLLSFIMTAMTFAQTDSVMLADYEPGSPYIFESGNWGVGGMSVENNPVQSGINTSTKVLRYVKKSQYNSAYVIRNLRLKNNPVSLFQYPIFKLKLMSDSSLSKVIRARVTDINGFSVDVTGTTPSTTNNWETVSFDFNPLLISTAISLIKEITIFIDADNTDRYGSRYYIDDIRFTNPQSSITTSTILNIVQEVFSSNGWWLTDRTGGTFYDYKTLGQYRTAEWGGSGLSAAAGYYNAADSLCMYMKDWNPNTFAKFFPASVRPGLSYLYWNNVDVKGIANMQFVYDLQWPSAPSNYSNIPTVEYQLDGGGWTALSTTSTLPSSTGSWTTGISFPLTGISGSTINFKITNASDASCYLENITFKGTKIFADSVKVTSAGNKEILATGATLQLSSTVYPTSIGQGVYWYIYSGNGSINSSGLYTGGTGDVKLRAMSKTFPNYYGEFSLHNYNLVDTIKVTPKNDTIKSHGGTLQMHAAIIPSNADSLNVTWSVTNLTGEATISATGLLTASGTKNGKVIVKATARDTSNVIGVDTITLINQIWVNDITVSTKDNATTITENGGTLQLFAAILPDTADIQTVTWSVVPGTGDGTIITRNDSVFVKASKNGTVHVKAKSTDGSNIADSVLLTFSNQLLITSVVITSTVDSIKTNKGTLQLTARAFPSSAADTIVLWKVISPSDVPDTATINTSTGLITAVRNGSVAVVAYSRSTPDVSDTIIVKIINQVVPVASVAIDSTVKTITVKGGTLALSPIISPADATNKSVTWSVDNTSLATINASTGLLTAVGGINGTVKVTATANDGTNVKGTLNITLSNQIIYVSGITVTGGTAINVKGGTLTMNADVTPANADNKGVTWSVDNTSLATIDANTGVLTAKGGVNGSVVVTATAKDGSNVKGTLSVTLSNQIALVSAITISGKSTIDVKNDTALLKATITPDNADNKAITWTVDNALIATVNAVTGVVTARTDGTVVVTATANDASQTKGTFTITITNQTLVNAIILAAGNRRIDVKGGTLQIVGVVYPTDAIDKSITWSVDNTNIATINASTGLLTATGNANGNVVVTATANDASNTKSTITINVYNQTILVTGITISGGSSIDINDGTLTLTATATPTDAADKSVTWSVNNTSIATINATTGVLTAVANGSVTVTATANDGSNVKGTATITISNQTGVNNAEIADVNIYPTLVANELTIAGSKDFKRIEIFNLQGKLLKILHDIAANDKINVSNLPSGMYMMRITEANNNLVTKCFVKE